jgi:hypothetical protein
LEEGPGQEEVSKAVPAYLPKIYEKKPDYEDEFELDSGSRAIEFRGKSS